MLPAVVIISMMGLISEQISQIGLLRQQARPCNRETDRRHPHNQDG